MKYFTIEIKKEKSEKNEYVKVVAPNVLVAIKWALKNCSTEGAEIEDVAYVNTDPVAIVEE